MESLSNSQKCHKRLSSFHSSISELKGYFGFQIIKRDCKEITTLFTAGRGGKDLMKPLLRLRILTRQKRILTAASLGLLYPSILVHVLKLQIQTVTVQQTRYRLYVTGHTPRGMTNGTNNSNDCDNQVGFAQCTVVQLMYDVRVGIPPCKYGNVGEAFSCLRFANPPPLVLPLETYLVKPTAEMKKFLLLLLPPATTQPDIKSVLQLNTQKIIIGFLLLLE